MAPLVTRP